MGVEFIIFDLDDTLYPRGSGVMEEIGRRIEVWVRGRLDLTREDATELRQRYLREYGTTMAGLVAEHDVDVDEYLSFVHDMPVDDYLEPDPALAEMLAKIGLRKVVYTHGTLEHALSVLRALAVADQFEQIIGIRDVDLCNKTSREAFERVLALLDAQGEACIMVEDSPRNLTAAKAVGMTTVLVDAHGDGTPRGVSDPSIDFAVGSVLHVGMVVDQMVGADGRGGGA